MSLSKHQVQVLRHLYVSPLSRCNFNCRMCYTYKNRNSLTQDQIETFIEKYRKVQDLQVVTLCGGEVFLLDYLPDLVNQLTSNNIFVQIITNGSIDRLKEFKNQNMVNLIVSLDGLPKYHDANRGSGNFTNSLQFAKRAQTLNFHLEVFSIITKQNFNSIEEFETLIKNKLGQINITYHPKKNMQYLSQHSVDNRNTIDENFSPPDNKQLNWLTNNRNTFPPKQFGCYQISLSSDGKVYGCCEGFTPLGDLDTPIPQLIAKLHQRIHYNGNLGCVEGNFACGFSLI